MPVTPSPRSPSPSLRMYTPDPRSREKKATTRGEDAARVGGGSSRLIERAARAKRSQVDFHTSTVANRIRCQKNARVQNQAHQASFSDAACVLPTGLQCGRNDGSFPISGLPCRRSRACSRSMSRSTQHPSQRRGLNVSWANRVPGLQSGTLAMSSSTIHCGCTSQGVGCIVLYRIQSLKR